MEERRANISYFAEEPRTAQKNLDCYMQGCRLSLKDDKRHKSLSVGAFHQDSEIVEYGSYE
ncbi:hypothetical protein KSD_72270 [Ktedonobacter sp. SOSP1-85]|nr:hypothetical protein KSD_72270 [Ktedonobacter sp. SOSP1-85]